MEAKKNDGLWTLPVFTLIAILFWMVVLTPENALVEKFLEVAR